ncbi:MAG: transporter substrate-binding domain-containing protein [Chitinispirillaceae bacterium]|jgi:hypothetical protein|nr:transporter substrate-binding domain-containing protein [Chitinispirillaceae bacterium]
MHNRTAPAVFTLLALLVLVSGETTEARTLRVGVYDNPPKIRQDDAGTPRGIFIDVIQYIAKCEKWDLAYVHGTWEECLSRLESDSIDIMPDVALSVQREQRFDFNRIPVLNSWLQVFRGKDAVLETISDLQGKTIAVLEGSTQQAACREISEKFGLEFTLIPLPSYEKAVNEVKSGKADAMVASRFYGYRTNGEKALIPTPVILYPTSLHIAAGRNRHPDILEAIDKHLASMLNDPSSAYYRSLDFWFQEKPRTFIPGFVLWTIASVFAALIFFFITSMVLRWQVRMRTKELKSAQDEAIKRERLHALGQLASGLAHDFNNLLVPIISYSDIMKENEEECGKKEKVRQCFESINTAARHGTEIVKRMQQFYRAVSSPEEKIRVDTNAIIREAVELVSVRLNRVPKEGIRIETVLNLGSGTDIIGRKTEIHEMLVNMILNAADAMPSGGRLEISTVNSGSAVLLTVKDSGTGMSDEVKEKCLQPFFTTKGDKGTGMGLLMVSRIVDEHGGRLQIESAPGAGTSFIITFPRN